MKLTSREIARYCAHPEPTRAGLLLYGADAMRVALRRQEVLRALIGPSGEEEMRLARMNGGDLSLNSDRSDQTFNNEFVLTLNKA